MGVTGIIITTRYEAKLLQSRKKTGNWKDNDCPPEISTSFTGPRMKTNSQRDGDV